MEKSRLEKFIIFIDSLYEWASKNPNIMDEIEAFGILLSIATISICGDDKMLFHTPEKYLNEMKKIMLTKEKMSEKQYKYLCDMLLASFNFADQIDLTNAQ